MFWYSQNRHRYTRRHEYIVFKEVALAPGFMTNFVSLNLLNDKDIHWITEKPTILTEKGQIFYSLDCVGGHWVIERYTIVASSFATTKINVRSKQPRHITYTRHHPHRVLAQLRYCYLWRHHNSQQPTMSENDTVRGMRPEQGNRSYITTYRQTVYYKQ